MAQAAGHDINYIALAGALAHFGREGGKPTPPINLVGDFGGGGMFMAFGVVCGILEAQRSGKGQVIDVAMVDGTAMLMTMMWGLKQDRLLGRGARASTCSTPARRSTTPTRRPTASSCRSVRSSRSSTRSSIAAARSRGRGLPAQMDRGGWDTLRDEVHRAVQDQDARRVGRDPARAATRATRRCSRCRRRRTTSTSRRATRSSSATACRSRRPRRASRAPSAEVQRSAPWPGQHTDEALGDWGFAADEIAKLRDDRRDRLARVDDRGERRASRRASQLGRIRRGDRDVAELAARARLLAVVVEVRAGNARARRRGRASCRCS